MKKLSILFIAITITMTSLYSQNKTIKGRVISEHLDILTGVSIMMNDTVEVGRADNDGFFQIDIPITEKKITFRFEGVEQLTIDIVDKCDNLEVVMMYLHSYDFRTLRFAERKRKKRFKKLPEIHKQAFEKGLFERDSACYKREYESFYLQEN